MTITPQIERDEIIYPSSDEEPMAESDITRSYYNMRLHSDVLDLDLCLISGELRFQNPRTGDFLLTHEEEREGRIEEKEARVQEKYARLQAEQSLKNLATQLLNSGFTVEQLAPMMQLSVEKVRLLLEE